MNPKTQSVECLLESMKVVHQEKSLLKSVGVDLVSFETVEDNLWDSIKTLVGMPEEKEGTFISDHWFGIAYDFIKGEIDKEKAVELIISWNDQEKEDAFLNCVHDFIEQQCITSPELKAKAGTVYDAFQNKLGIADLSIVSNRAFYKAIRNLGYEVKRGTKNKFYIIGIDLKSEAS
ncbi:hypothetical protein K7887_22020 (plasmid) [Sutcliffiella horikoshii]|uniref:hypothetical protein n=1 Tax=Sutcliffiella horikoshii TaxID=79883 RepID=UPI001CBEBF88|nr:hypothetical protein [Sutcliffiella horikoshii]UAL49725.1 hypothetical protein K7887_22020 [Sutcliffiella horikoshii]